MIRLLSLILALVLVQPTPGMGQAASDGGTFVIRHSSDTVAIETFTRSTTRLEGTLVLRDKNKTNQRYTAVIGPDATLPLMDVTIREGTDSAGRKARVTQRARVIFKEDSVAIDAIGGDGIQTRVFQTDWGAVPYLNLSFALLEQAIWRARVSPDTSQVAFFNLGGGQTLSGRLSRFSGDSLRLTIGTVEYHFLVDRTGRLLGARIPAQDVVVERQ